MAELGIDKDEYNLTRDVKKRKTGKGSGEALSQYIKRKSLDGKRLADFLFGVLEIKDIPGANREKVLGMQMKAAELLINKGFPNLDKEDLANNTKNNAPVLEVVFSEKKTIGLIGEIGGVNTGGGDDFE